jgi:uncharacterized protein
MSSDGLSPEAVRMTQPQRVAFVLALTVSSRAIYLRDWALGRLPRQPDQVPGLTLTRLTIRSGASLLDAVHVAPDAEPARSAVLICHGIGEVVSQWVRIQCLLAAYGIASLVFDYSGYGRSTGRPHLEQLEQDAIASFAHMRELTPLPISLLGFSLGTGIVPAIVNRVVAHRLVLCASFTSFRAAALRVGILPFLGVLVPPVWDSRPILRSGTHNVLFTHSTGDRLFPIAMAEELAACCGKRARLSVVHGLGHNEPFYKPTQAYWNPIAEFLTAPDSDLAPASTPGHFTPA